MIWLFKCDWALDLGIKKMLVGVKDGYKKKNKR